MLMITGFSVLVAYAVFMVGAERMLPYPVPRGTVSRKRWRRAVRLAPVAGLLVWGFCVLLAYAEAEAWMVVGLGVFGGLVVMLLVRRGRLGHQRTGRR